MPTNVNFSGVSNCYVFKEPTARICAKSGSSYTRVRDAEHCAAEIALMELSKAGEINESVSQPVHETCLCKNLIQEYAQKMNYAMPLYQCQKDETAGRLSHYSCTVEIGGIRYIGAAAKTKKEAEIKAARIALLAIQSRASELSNHALGNSQLVVIPCRKGAAETASNPDETAPKAKKAQFKKKLLKKLSRKNTDRFQEKTTEISVIDSDDLLKSEGGRTDSFTILSSETLAGTEILCLLQVLHWLKELNKFNVKVKVKGQVLRSSTS